MFTISITKDYKAFRLSFDRPSETFQRVGYVSLYAKTIDPLAAFIQHAPPCPVSYDSDSESAYNSLHPDSVVYDIYCFCHTEQSGAILIYRGTTCVAQGSYIDPGVVLRFFNPYLRHHFDHVHWIDGSKQAQFQAMMMMQK